MYYISFSPLDIFLHPSYYFELILYYIYIFYFLGLKFYTSCFGTGEVKWELLALLTVVNMLLLLLNVNYKENINHLNNKKSETSDINDDLINVDMHEFSNNEKDESSDENEKEKKYNKLKIRYLYNVSNSIICYYSLWILCYYLIYFLCFLSFLYGIRKFNNNVINIYTLRTCKIDCQSLRYH